MYSFEKPVADPKQAEIEDLYLRVFGTPDGQQLLDSWKDQLIRNIHMPSDPNVAYALGLNDRLRLIINAVETARRRRENG